MLDVPESPRYRMTAAPLVQALVQVNYPIIPRLQTPEGAAEVQAALGSRFPYLSQTVVQQVALMAGPAGPAVPQATQSLVHELTSDDGWSLTLAMSSATLSVGPQYAGIDDFAVRFAEVCSALVTAGGVSRCDRLGVRYLDLVDVDGAEDWDSWFRPEVVGIASPRLTGQTLVSSLTETRLRGVLDGQAEALPAAAEGILRYGVVPSGSVLVGVPPRPIEHRAFVFDLDLFVAAPQPFDRDTLPEQLLALHVDIERVFHWAVTDDGKQRFGYRRLAEGEE